MINIKTGQIFNIQKFSVNDGPGIRTTVFMKGCPLSCIWCHNPESKMSCTEVFYDSQKCALCGKCGEVCTAGCHIFKEGAHVYNRDNCKVCGKCADACPVNNIELVGKPMSADDVIKEVLKDKAFYDNSGGGITLSGGEPMLQFDFTYQLLTLAKQNGLHTCMETCGFAPIDNYKIISQYVDIFLFDYKETDLQKHKQFTGVSNELILSNLHELDNIGCKTILRCPIIPTLNDREEHFCGISDTANKLKNIIEINVEPYHPLGKSKAERLNKDYELKDLTFPDNETVANWIDIISSKTNVPVKKA